MPDSIDVRSVLGVFLQKKTSSRVINTLFQKMRWFEALIGLKGARTTYEGIGWLNSGEMIGNAVAKAKREQVLAQRIYYPMIQIKKPDRNVVKSMQDYDSVPTVANGSADAALGWFQQPAFKFVYLNAAWEVWHSDADTAKTSARGNENISPEAAAANAVGSVYSLTTETTEGVLCETMNNQFFGVDPSFPNAAPTDETLTRWDCFHSLQNIIHDGNVYAGINRADSNRAWWRGIRLTAADSGTFEDRLNYINYTYNGGIVKIGGCIQLVLVDSTQFVKAKAEAKSENDIIHGQIPELGEYGFKGECVRVWAGPKPAYVMHEPSLPTGHGAFLDPTTFTTIIHPSRNFKVNGPFDQTKIEGGDEKDTGQIRAEVLVACEAPSLNAYFTNLK